MVDAYARGAVLTSVRGGTTVARVTTRLGQTDDRSKALVRTIRATPPPDGFTLLVGGGTAGVIDYVDTLYQEFPQAAVFVVVAIYGVLSVVFRWVVLPFKALVMNSLSLLASYGATIVRALLVPATMRLLGEWNWWAPQWLRRNR
jgi:RND superfamily putative drug exporter